MSVHVILIVVGVVVVGALISVVSSWIGKPARLTGTAAVALLAVAVVALVFLTLDQTGALGHAKESAAPPASPPVNMSQAPRTPKTRAPRNQRTHGPRAHRTHPAVTGQPGQNPQSSARAPDVDAANEVLSATMSPWKIRNDGQDVEVQVTVKNATPGGQVTWEEDARAAGSYPGQTPCLINSSGSWCGMDLLHGVVTANGSGVATFNMTFIPGRIYDDLKLKSVSAFDNVIWEATVWDDATFKPSTGSRSAGCAPGIRTLSSAPPPADWSTS